MRIDSLTLKSFRGATNETHIEFDQKKQFTLIYGENGTGKSTIVDGIDCLCNENCGSLEGRSLDGGHKRKHLPSLGKADSDVTVEVKSGAKTWTSRLSNSGPKTLGPSPRPQVHVLRRARITKLVEATAQQKYDELASFVSVTQVEDAEAELLKAFKAAEAGFNESTRAVEVANRTLENTWIELQKPGAPKLDHIAWAEQESLRDSSEELKQAEAARELMAQMDVLRAASNRLTKSMADFNRLEVQRASLLGDSNANQSFSLGQQRDLVQVLQQAARFLSGDLEGEACPVCETPQSLSALRNRIDERILSLNTANEQLGELQRCEANLKTAEPIYENAKREALAAAVQLAKLWVKSQAPLPTLPVPEGLESFLLAEVDVDVAEPLVEGLAMRTESIRPLLAGIVERAALEDKHLASIRNNLATLKEERAKARDWEAKQRVLGRIHTEVRKMRLDFAQGVLNEVHADCDAIYQAMHPGEGIGPEALELDPEKRGSISLPCRYGTHSGVSPAAYYSESHTDTLGLALFIAIAKRQGGKDSILVLDDVFTSVDGPHLNRVMVMLADQAKHFGQVIVTTHFRRMYDLYRHHRASIVDLKELDRWRLDQGVGVNGTKLELHHLKEVLKAKPLDRNGIASRAGYLLDATLDHLTLKFETSAPRKAGDYTLKDLYDSFRKVAKVMRVQQGGFDGGTWKEDGAEVDIAPLFAALDGSNLIRNQVGGHFNELGQDISDSEVEEFGSRVETLVDAVICKHCQCLPTKAKDAHWECDCGACRTTPRRKPN